MSAYIYILNDTENKENVSNPTESILFESNIHTRQNLAISSTNSRLLHSWS